MRSWHSYGGFDTAGPVSIRNAHAAGIPYVDGYLFPCAGKSASAQVQGTLNGLSENGARIGTLWLDIETNPSRGCGWSADKASNCNFIKDMIKAGHAAGRTIGVYSSPYEWSTVAGNCNIRGEFSDVPLWYAHYDVSSGATCLCCLPRVVVHADTVPPASSLHPELQELQRLLPLRLRRLVQACHEAVH